MIKPQNKAIIYSNTAAKITSSQLKIDNWLDASTVIPGDSAIVIDDQETEYKIQLHNFIYYKFHRKYGR